MTLQLLSDTPLFHGLAIPVIEDDGDADLVEFLKTRCVWPDLRVGDPHAENKPMLAITASKKVVASEADIPTATLPRIDPMRRRIQPIDSTIVDWSPDAAEG